MDTVTASRGNPRVVTKIPPRTCFGLFLLSDGARSEFNGRPPCGFSQWAATTERNGTAWEDVSRRFKTFFATLSSSSTVGGVAFGLNGMFAMLTTACLPVTSPYVSEMYLEKLLYCFITVHELLTEIVSRFSIVFSDPIGSCSPCKSSSTLRYINRTQRNTLSYTAASLERRPRCWQPADYR